MSTDWADEARSKYQGRIGVESGKVQLAAEKYTKGGSPKGEATNNASVLRPGMFGKGKK